jgi:hypothetical protein
MKEFSWTRGLILLAAGLLIVQSGCEYKAPVSPWEQAQNATKAYPVINSVEPVIANQAREITINGGPFSTVASENSVYFYNVPAIIKRATENQIVVYRPNTSGDSLAIKVTVAGKVGIAAFSPYRLEPVVEPFGSFAGTEVILTSTVDKNENVYLAMGNLRAIRFNSAGVRDFNFNAITPNNLWTDMKVGSDGNVYLSRGNNIIYRIIPSGGALDSTKEYVKMASSKSRMTTFDFAQDGATLFAGGKNSDLLIIRAPKDTARANIYGEYDIKSLRVFNGYVYVAAQYLGATATIPKTAIWRHQILANSLVGNQELVLDWTVTEYGTATINTITFSQSGSIFIASNHADMPILIFNPADNGLTPLFYGITPSPIDQLVWGNSTYQYALVNRNVTNTNGGRIIRINTGEQGAPYYGRN